MWTLIAAVVLLALILNLRQWRADLEHLHKISARRNKLPAHCPDRNAPKVSFLVAAWNEESTLEACIEAIERLRYPNFEVILCAGGTDNTWHVACNLAYKHLIVLKQQAGDGKQKSLVRCMEKAGGEIIYLVDAGCLLTEAAFARILAPIVNGEEQAVTGMPCTPFPEQIRIPFVASQCASQVYTSIHQPKYGAAILGANSALRRRTLEQAGGLNPAVRTGGDYELGKRLARQGTRVRYEADASFPIEFHTRVRPYVRQQARWIRNVVIHGMRFGAYREVASCLSTSLVGLAMLGIPSFWLAWWLYRGTSPAVVTTSAVLWGFAFSHAFFSRLRYLDTARRWLGVRFPRRTAILLPLFLLVDFLAWSIPLVEYPARSLRERW